MEAGKLDRRVTILKRVETKNSFGEIIENFVVDRDIWAQRIQVQGNERFIIAQFVDKVDTLFKIRWRTGLNAITRLRFEGNDYDVYGVLEIGRKEGLAINASMRGE